jgi:chemotaxis protein MotB
MMTLLFGFFVMVSAFSTPDAEKIEKLKKATVEYLDAPYVEPTEGLAESLQQVLQDYKLEDDVRIVATEEGLTMSSRGTIFFDSGSAELKPIAQDLLERVGDVLVEMARGFKVFVEGHTDDAPINTARYPSNWELSAARASVVVRLLEARGFPHRQLRPIGFADVEPALPNYDSKGRPIEENRARNRRIVIRLQKMLPRRMPPLAPPAGKGDAEPAEGTSDASEE